MKQAFRLASCVIALAAAFALPGCAEEQTTTTTTSTTERVVHPATTETRTVRTY